MTDRKQTPDILGSLLGDTPKKPEDQSTIKPEYHKAGIPVSHKDSKPVKQPTIKTEGKPTSKPVSQKKTPGDKVKATFYIEAEAVEALEDGWIQLRKLAPKKARSHISKSLIVELALQMALEDLKAKGSSSQIAKKSL